MANWVSFLFWETAVFKTKQGLVSICSQVERMPSESSRRILTAMMLQSFHELEGFKMSKMLCIRGV